MPATASWRGPTPLPSWPRRRSSCRPCSRCWRAERARDRVPHTRVQLDVSAAITAHLDDARPLALERPLERLAKAADVSCPLVREPVQRGGHGEVEPRGGRDVPRIDVLAACALARPGLTPH